MGVAEETFGVLLSCGRVTSYVWEDRGVYAEVQSRVRSPLLSTEGFAQAFRATIHNLS